MKKYILAFSLISVFCFLNESQAAESCIPLFNGKPNKIIAELEAKKDSVTVTHTELGLGMVLFLKKEEGSVIFISKRGQSIENVSFDEIYLPLPKTASNKDEVAEGITFQFENGRYQTVGQFADGSVMAEHQSGFSFLKRIELKDLEAGVKAISKEIYAGDTVRFVEEGNRINAEVVSIEGIYAKVSYEKEGSGFDLSVETITKLVPLSLITNILKSNHRDPGLL